MPVIHYGRSGHSGDNSEFPFSYEEYLPNISQHVNLPYEVGGAYD